ncbi:unnamed protein product [Prorocentrum cordatum]|uniref:Uncharacterized protein n=1 Tax=Prorocentrum cordatum TaxID=2364126 RepID=A0ABN9X3J4_9DINO|nr:unnamed protein product [Polarella glacialis]
MWGAKVEPNDMSYTAGMSACRNGLQWQRALSLLGEMRAAKLVPNALLQRWGKCVREKWEMATGSVVAQRDAGGEVRARLSFTAGIRACKKGRQWQQALSLFSEMREATLEPNVASYSAGVGACEEGGQRQQALSLLSEIGM